MSKKTIPERTEIICDFCGVLCDSKNHRLSGVIQFKFDGLDYQGQAVGSAGFVRDCCDTCLGRAREALAAEFTVEQEKRNEQTKDKR